MFPDKTQSSKKPLYVASIDIGYKNFSIYIEKFLLSSLKNIELPSKKDRYLIDGELTTLMKKSVKDVCDSGVIVHHSNTNLTVNLGNDYDMFCIMSEMSKYLDTLSKFWKTCSVILVERQMNFGRLKSNVKATRLSHHCMSWFSIKYPNTKVVEFPAYYKTQLLGCPKKKGKKWYVSISKPLRKKWAVNEASSIFKSRHADEFSESFEKSRKKDDLADTMLQLQAYKILLLDNL